MRGMVADRVLPRQNPPMTGAREGLEQALPGLTVRGAALADVTAATAVIAACEIAAHGFAEMEEADVAESWARPSIDLARDVVLVLDGGAVVACAETYRGRGEGYVHPAYRGLGIGTALVEWWTARAAEHGLALAGQTVSDDDPTAVALLQGLGCAVAHTSWILRYPLGDEPPAPASPPDGIAIRLLQPGEERALFHLIDDAFAHWEGRARGVYDDWAAMSVASPRWEPWMGVVAVDGDRLVGAAVLRQYPGEGWIDQIAVAGGYRGRGIGRALLQHTFGVFHGRDPVVGLSTDSRTGALDLYLHVGMTVRRTYRRWSRPTGATLPV
jgi:ribosomal protein S18 acetylase RimI-like enzyme